MKLHKTKMWQQLRHAYFHAKSRMDNAKWCSNKQIYFYTPQNVVVLWRFKEINICIDE